MPTRSGRHENPRLAEVVVSDRKESDTRYNLSKKGKARHDRYNASEKGIKRYEEWYERLYPSTFPPGGLTKKQQIARLRRTWASWQRDHRRRLERIAERREKEERAGMTTGHNHG